MGILVRAHREFEERVGVVKKVRGAKTAIIEQAIERLPSIFAFSDLERSCPSISRDMIRVFLNRLRKERRLPCKGTGRNAFWENVVRINDNVVISDWRL